MHQKMHDFVLKWQNNITKVLKNIIKNYAQSVQIKFRSFHLIIEPYGSHVPRFHVVGDSRLTTRTKTAVKRSPKGVESEQVGN